MWRRGALALLVLTSMAPSVRAQVAAPQPFPFFTAVSVAVVAIALLLIARRLLRGSKHKATPSLTAGEEAMRESPLGGLAATTEAVRSGRSVFISYRRSDSSDIVGRIYDRLVARFGKEHVFKDVDSIPLGVDFRQHLEEAVGECGVALAVIGRGWLDAKTQRRERRLDDPRDHLRIEIETALVRGIPLVPVLVQSASLPAERDLPRSLRPLTFRNGIQVRPDPDFHGDVARLIRGIEAHLPAAGHDPH